jgi:hypothetical protein
MQPLAICAQIVIACSIAFVWIAHFPNVVKEFHEYGLSDFIRTLVGATKICLATLLVVGIWYPAIVMIPAILMACLMLCALAAHRKVHHRWQKYLPSALLLVLSLFVAEVYGKSIHI